MKIILKLVGIDHSKNYLREEMKTLVITRQFLKRHWLTDVPYLKKSDSIDEKSLVERYLIKRRLPTNIGYENVVSPPKKSLGRP